jgi:hypothetical protein
LKLIDLTAYRFPGFVEARLVPNRESIAFIEFEEEVNATAAKEGLQGFNFTPMNKLLITYAKK